MIKRTIEISQQPFHLAVKDRQLLLLARDEQRSECARIPAEDIGLLLIEHAGTTISHPAVTTLLENGAAVVFCGRDHLPVGQLLPIADHSENVRRLHLQIAVGKVLKKRLWRQIVRGKIRTQARNLLPGSVARSRLLAMARELRSGDPENAEAHAARVYWAAWRGSLLSDFRRDPDGPSPNNLLNYGYAVLRAAVARAIVSAGLHPALGVHHSNRANAFCLADDLVEPLRPIVDARVLELARGGEGELTPEVKRALLELLTAEVRTGDFTGPLLVALHRYAASLVRCFEGAERELAIPVPHVAQDAEPDACT